MRRSSYFVVLLCSVGVGVSVAANPVAAKGGTWTHKQCIKEAAAWVKKHPKAKDEEVDEEKAKLLQEHSCSFSENDIVDFLTALGVSP